MDRDKCLRLILAQELRSEKNYPALCLWAARSSSSVWGKNSSCFRINMLISSVTRFVLSIITFGSSDWKSNYNNIVKVCSDSKAFGPFSPFQELHQTKSYTSLADLNLKSLCKRILSAPATHCRQLFWPQVSFCHDVEWPHIDISRDLWPRTMGTSFRIPNVGIFNAKRVHVDLAKLFSDVNIHGDILHSWEKRHRNSESSII